MNGVTIVYGEDEGGEEIEELTEQGSNRDTIFQHNLTNGTPTNRKGASTNPTGKYTNLKAKGKLFFRCNFENGNLDAARETVPQAEWDLEIRGDTNNSKYRVWFYFAVSNVKNKQVCIFNVINFSKGRSLYREGMTPLVRSTKRTHWQRIPSRNSFYYKSPKHKMNYVLSFIFEFDNEDEEYFFAYSFPYTYSDLQKYLYQIESRKLSFCKRELLCKTILQRRVDLLVIGKDPRGTRNSLSQIESRRGERRRVVFVSARV
mmetsp:Transcript_38954/g.122905  ORF Transcript_38954/g.122905 Transcript_38954/m.122905 type:complete len:260 (+) Transcript_38954:75-854(+)